MLRPKFRFHLHISGSAFDRSTHSYYGYTKSSNLQFRSGSQMHRMFMENKREAKGPRFKPYDGVVSPINSTNVANSRRSRSSFDPYASDSSDSPSPLMKFLRSVDPANSGASSPPLVTPAKVEEDVIVMDGISVPKSNKGSSEVRMRLPLMSSTSVNCSFGRSNSTVSSSSPGRRSVVEKNKFFMNRLCHYWETSGICQFGSECQFAHGKEELCYHYSTGKIKLEISKLKSSVEGSTPSPSPSPSPYGPKFPRHSQIKAASTAAEDEIFSLPSLPLDSPTPAKKLSGSSSMSNNSVSTSDWTPEVDGIEVSLASGSTVEKGPSKEDVDTYIENVLYGTEVKKRLPVFVEIFHHS